MRIKLIKVNNRICFPNYADSISFTTSRENDSRYFRTVLNDNLVFTNGNGDYDFINSQPFDTEFNVEITLENNYKWTGLFYKTDCTFNADDKTISVRPVVRDIYTNVLNRMDDEVDLVDLAPAISEIKIHKRPIQQTFIVRGSIPDTIVTNVIGNMIWEEDVKFVFDDTMTEPVIRAYLTNVCHFKVDKGPAVYYFESNDHPFVSGTYARTSDGINIGTERFVDLAKPTSAGGIKEYTFYRIGGGSLRVRYEITSAQTMPITYRAITTFSFYNADGVMLEQRTHTETSSNIPTSWFGSSMPDMGTTTFTDTSYMVYRRILTDTKQTSVNLEGQMVPVYKRPAEDLTDNNLNYLNVVAWAASDNGIIFSRATSTNPTKYGKDDSGKYFTKVSNYALAQSTWNPFSIWMSHDGLSQYDEAVLDVIYTLKDSYELSDVIKTLLAKLVPDDGITFEPTSQYSAFLYGAGTFASRRICISPTSNVKKTYYENPAQKGTITLASLLDMLRECYNLYWFIDEDKRFHLEHVDWFFKGESPLDMADKIAPRNRMNWNYGQNVWTFNKEDLPERVEFEYSQSGTDMFAGVTQYESNFVQKGMKDTITIGDFAADVDYIVAMPNNVPDDGWVVLIPNRDSRTFALSLPIMELPTVGIELTDTKRAAYQYARVQNPYATRVWQMAHPMRYDMPCPTFTFNDESGLSALSVKKARKQNIVFPGALDGSFDPMSKVVTQLGEADPVSLQFAIHTNTITADLLLSNE